MQRELARLSGSGLLTVTRVGTQKHYQANAESAVFAELCAIARPELALVTSIGPEHLELVGTVEQVAEANAEAIVASIRDVTKLRGEVAFHAPGELLADRHPLRPKE